MAAVLPIHPFPARMAPEIALNECARLPRGAVVLDPMAGSGTVLRAASDQGLRGLGYDLDPLAVLLAKVWTTPLDPYLLQEAATSVVSTASTREPLTIHLPWIDDDPETHRFVDYWFGEPQKRDLRRLSAVIGEIAGPIGDALRVALSCIIVTKDRGASLARDVSHSRPHRAWDHTDFDVFSGFSRSANRLAQRMEKCPTQGNVLVESGDARSLRTLQAASVDAAITSPPYLNAIDYLRGHRLSLIWMGHRVSDLRVTRAVSIGAERRPEPAADEDLAKTICSELPGTGQLPERLRRMIHRYALDMFAVVTELHRVVRVGGAVVLVVGNSCLRGVFIENARLITRAAEDIGFRLVARHERELPPSRRYLPPPMDARHSTLEKRMRTESVLSFQR